MSDGNLRGTVHVVEPTKTFGQNGFRKRLVVLEQDKGRFTNYVPVEFLQDSCDAVDELKVGDVIDVTFRLTGRKWQKDSKSEVKYFLSAEAMKYDVVQRKSGGQKPADADRPFPDESEALAGDDEVPF